MFENGMNNVIKFCKKLATVAGCFMAASAMASASNDLTPVVTERIGSATVTPDWASGAKPMWKEKDQIIFAYSLEMNGASRTSSCMKAASLQARTEMRRFISESITSSELLSQPDLTSDPEFEAVTASLTQGQISGAAVNEQYWEKVLVTDVRGERRLRLRCSSQIKVSRNDLDRQMNKTVKDATKNNPEIRQALMTSQTKFLDTL